MIDTLLVVVCLAVSIPSIQQVEQVPANRFTEQFKEADRLADREIPFERYRVRGIKALNKQALGGFVKPNNKMKTLDEKAAEYAANVRAEHCLENDGLIKTAYVFGATDNAELKVGEIGTFGQALVALQRGGNIARKEWGGKCFIVKQINSDIASDIVPKMQSLPDAAKKEISKYADGSIHYREQCLVVYPDMRYGCMATNYVPDWQDMFANDWMVVNP